MAKNLYFFLYNSINHWSFCAWNCTCCSLTTYNSMCQWPTHEGRSVPFPLNVGKSLPPVKACEPSSVEIIITIHKASQTISQRFYSALIQILLNSFVIWILHLFKYIKISKVTKLLAYEIQTPFKWTKHGSLHFLWLVHPTLVCLSPRHWPPHLLPPPTLFTDYLQYECPIQMR